MSDSDQDNQPSEADAELEREVRAEREFTLSEAIGRLVGPGGMKGASPVARKQQAEIEIETWLRHHLADAAGALQVVLLRRIRASDLLLNNFEQPLVVLAAYCRQVVGADYQLQELVRDTDIEWGRAFDERPHFEKEGSSPHPDDPYTLESVHCKISDLIAQLEEAPP